MSTVIPFRRKQEDTPEPIETIFENLLFDLKNHGYWNPSENDYTNAHMCLMFEAIESYINDQENIEHPLQEVANAIDDRKLHVLRKNSD